MAEELGFTLVLKQPYEQALETVTAALKTQGFGVLTKIDVRATLKEKLGEDFRPYSILGACNPPLAHKALTHAPEAGLLLPCNVTVEESQPGETLVRIVNPLVMMKSSGLPENAALQEVAEEAHDRIHKVIQVLQAVTV